MNVTGIIAEYNPFHKGHQYQIHSLRQNTSTEYIIVIMSGNFLQRGTPAVIDKYTRTKMALLGGADLVLELPVCFSTASAELFARGGVALLNTTGVTNMLCFGAETDNLDILTHISHILATESPEYSLWLHKYLKEGLSFPAARANALDHLAKHAINNEAMNAVMKMPNNILAIEYIKALMHTKSSIKPYLLKREGSGYHDPALTVDFSSASAIRRSIFAQNSTLHLQHYLPDTTWQLMEEYGSGHKFLTENDFSLPLKYKLLSATREELCTFADSSAFLANRICHKRDAFISWEQFLGLLKTKEVTYTRLSRLLTHILLEIRADELCRPPANILPYMRVLGFRRAAEPLLREIKASGKAPMITKVSAAQKKLSDFGITMLEKDLFAAHLYQSVLTENTHQSYPNEYRRKMLVIP